MPYKEKYATYSKFSDLPQKGTINSNHNLVADSLRSRSRARAVRETKLRGLLGLPGFIVIFQIAASTVKSFSMYE
mgnify:CR=1 FL=1